MPGRVILSFLFLSLLFNSVYSQYDNRFFDHDRYDKVLDSSHFQWHFDNLNYFYNTEYTSLVDKGSTYPGFQLLPYIQYSFHDKAEIFGGLFVRYDFGNPELKTLEPYIKFVYRLWGHDLIFGNIEGSVQHRLVEPIYSYEYAVTDRMEQGLQIKKQGKTLEYDAWVDWRTMIYEGDPFNEEFFGGLNFFWHPVNTNRHKLSLNAQATTVHKAGEIDKSLVANAMEYNFAYGLAYELKWNTESSLYLAGYTSYYEDVSGIPATGFKDGLGQLGVLRLKHGDYQFVLNYWDAHQFQSPTGDPLYFSIGRKNQDNPFNYRKMAGARIAYEVEIGKNLVFLNRLGLNYNIDHTKADVVMENYLRWHFRSKAKKITLY